MFVVGIAVAYPAEQHGSPAQKTAVAALPSSAGADFGARDGTTATLEGKEQRFGIATSALWATATTDASNGSVNSAHESYTGAGGAVPLVNIMTGEVIFGGVGSGMYGTAAVRPARGIHRRPHGRAHAGVPGQEDRRARDQARGHRDLRGAALRPGQHRCCPWRSERGGSPSSLPARRASPRRSTPTPRRATTTAQPSPATPASSSPTPRATPAPRASTSPTSSAASRCSSAAFAPLLAALAVAGAFAVKRVAPPGAGTLRTDTPTFVALLVGTIVLVAALTFVPALLLGPVVQALSTQLF